MNGDNGFYGHRRIVNRFVATGTGQAIDPDAPLWGYLQHGWNRGRGYADAQPLRPGFAKYVWNGRNAQIARAEGLTSVTPIGAPFCYLVEMLEAEESEERQPRAGTLVYPFHATRVNIITGSHTEYVDQLREREGDDVTICLYWLEYRDPEIRKVYEASGWRVISHGFIEDDPDFLVRQYAELRRHRRVVSNRAATAVWYAGYAGAEIEVYGSVFGERDDADAVRQAQYQRERWPDLCGGGLDAEAARELASIELGREFRRAPAELGDVLGVTGWRGRLGPSVARAISIRRRGWQAARRLLDAAPLRRA